MMAEHLFGHLDRFSIMTSLSLYQELMLLKATKQGIALYHRLATF